MRTHAKSERQCSFWDNNTQYIMIAYCFSFIHLSVVFLYFMPQRFRFSWNIATKDSLVVHTELCSSLEHPTPLIFIPTLNPHLHLSPPPRPPHPSLLLSLHHSPSLSRFARLLSLFQHSRSITCLRVTPCTLHAEHFLLLFLLCVCPSLSTLHL